MRQNWVMASASPATSPAVGVPTTSRGRAAVAAERLVRAARRTPGTLMVALGGIWLLTLITFLIARNGLLDARAAAETIGRSAEPNVINARQIASSLTDMHAHVANAFLLGFRERSDDWDIYERQRATVAQTLALAQQTNTDPEAVPTLRQLASDYGVYQDTRSRDSIRRRVPPGTARPVSARKPTSTSPTR